MKIILDIQDNKAELFLEFIKNLSFVQKAEPVVPNEITNERLLKSMEDYETGKIKPTPMNLDELKAIIDAKS